jgi:hypothetical protein
MRDSQTATLTATRSTFSSSTKIIMHDHPPGRDHRVPSRTLWVDLRVRWFIPPTNTSCPPTGRPRSNRRPPGLRCRRAQVATTVGTLNSRGEPIWAKHHEVRCAMGSGTGAAHVRPHNRTPVTRAPSIGQQRATVVRETVPAWPVDRPGGISQVESVSSQASSLRSGPAWTLAHIPCPAM